MTSNIFIYTEHAKERFEERFPLLNQTEEIKHTTRCNKDEISRLRATAAYRNTKTSKKAEILHFKTDQGVYFICERKIQKDEWYANVIITVIDLYSEENEEKDNFFEDMIRSEYELDQIGKLSYQERFSKKKAVSQQESIYKFDKKSSYGKFERIIRTLNECPYFNDREYTMDMIPATKYDSKTKFLTPIKKIINNLDQADACYRNLAELVKNKELTGEQIVRFNNLNKNFMASISNIDKYFKNNEDKFVDCVFYTKEDIKEIYLDFKALKQSGEEIEIGDQDSIALNSVVWELQNSIYLKSYHDELHEIQIDKMNEYLPLLATARKVIRSIETIPSIQKQLSNSKPAMKSRADEKKINVYNNKINELKNHIKRLDSLKEKIEEHNFGTFKMKSGFEKIIEYFEKNIDTTIPESLEVESSRLNLEMNILRKNYHFKDMDVTSEDFNEDDYKTFAKYVDVICRQDKLAVKLNTLFKKLNDLNTDEPYVLRNHMVTIKDTFKRLGKGLEIIDFNNSNITGMELIKPYYQEFLKDIIETKIKAIDLIYRKSGSFSNVSYKELYTLFLHAAEVLDDKELVTEFIEYISPYQTKVELNSIYKEDELLTKVRLLNNLSHLNTYKGVLDKNNEIVAKIDNIINFYNLIIAKMDELEEDSFYLQDYM